MLKYAYLVHIYVDYALHFVLKSTKIQQGSVFKTPASF